MEENEEKNVNVLEEKQVTKETKKKRTTKKKNDENGRLSGILEKIEEEQKEENVKKETKKETKPKTIKKVKDTKKTEPKNESAKKDKGIKEKKDTIKKVKETKETKEVKDKKSKIEKTEIKKEEKKNENSIVKETKEVKKGKNIKKEKALMASQDVKIKQLEEIKEEIEKQRKIPEDIQNQIDKSVFRNTIIAIGILIYLILINIAYDFVSAESFVIALRALSIVTIFVTIVIFEIAYKKDSGKLTINGIEFLVLSIIIMMLPRLYQDANDLFMRVVNLVAILYATYYEIKSLIIYIKLSKKVRKSDANKITKKERKVEKEEI